MKEIILENAPLIIMGAPIVLYFLYACWDEWDCERMILRDGAKFRAHMRLPIDRTRFSDGSVNLHEVNRLAKELGTKDKGEALKQ